jgi:glutamyl-tRNA synthetase
MAHRLRFAPSPTGYLHVGSARTALFNWLYVKHYGGQFLLRVEDTDRARSTDESTRAIFEGLGWLGLGWDEDVVFQGANLARHQADTQRLLEADAAYRCFCTPAELDEMRKAAEARGDAFKYDRRCARLAPEEVARRMSEGTPFVIRFRMPDGETSWTDLVHGPIKFANKDIGEGDFIILRSDATPIYNLAVVSDDIAMGITLVMRGDDHISNTPKQILLYRALGAAVPEFAHLPMIHGLDGKKLSKRHGATAVGDYRHMGILPEAMLNFLALLGWSPGGDVEVMTMQQMVEAFSVEGLSKNAAVFDTKKLEWMNGQHLSMLSAEQLMPTFVKALTATESLAQVFAGGDAGIWVDPVSEAGLDWLRSLVELLKVRARTVDDMVRQAMPYLRNDISYDEDAVAKTWKDPKAAHEILAATRDALADAKPWDAAALEGELRTFAASRGIAAGKLFQPLRLALTGVTASPGIFDVLVLLGRERSLARLDAALAWLAAAGAATDAKE